MKRYKSKEPPSSCLSPSMQKKLSTVLECVILEKEMEVLNFTSYDSACLLSIKISQLEDEIASRLMDLEAMGLVGERSEDALNCAETLLQILAT